MEAHNIEIPVNDVRASRIARYHGSNRYGTEIYHFVPLRLGCSLRSNETRGMLWGRIRSNEGQEALVAVVEVVALDKAQYRMI